MLYLLFFWSCVVPYGTPLVSHISENKIVEPPVDFSPLHTKLDALLVGQTDRFELARLRECERLLGVAKSWEPHVQKEIYSFVEKLLESPSRDDVGLETSEPVQEMEFSMDSVPLEESEEQGSERVYQAQELAQAGDILGAIELLEQCRSLPCWSDVYIHWAKYSDIEFNRRVEEIKKENLSMEKERVLWEALAEDFSHPTYQAQINKELKRIQSAQDTP